MMNAAVAKRYGQALLQIGQEKNSIDRYQEDLKLVVDTMENSAELKDVLTSQTVSVDEKKNIVIGGAYSVDKYYRLSAEMPWFEGEQLSDIEKEYHLHTT